MTASIDMLASRTECVYATLTLKRTGEDIPAVQTLCRKAASQ